MNESMAGLEEFCGVYLNDIIVYSRCILQHLGYLHTVLFYLQEHMLFFKHPNCDFLKSLLHFFGHMISPGGVASDPSKMSAICDIAAATSVLDLHSFLGCTNFYERFVP